MMPVGFRDPAFAANRSAPVHRWVPWIAGFSKHFIEDAISTYLSGHRQTVLDPFAGVGTTLVEADLAGHDAVGFEINPYAAFAARLKLGAHRLPVGALRETVQALKEHASTVAANGAKPRAVAPERFRTRAPFYSPAVERKVLLFHDFMRGQSDDQIVGMLQLAFASTMVEYSNYSYEPSLGRRESAGRAGVDDHPVAETIAAKLSQMVDDADWYRRMRKWSEYPDGRVYVESFFDGYNRLDQRSVDLLVTSPPYANNYHYNRNTRPQLYWLGLVESPRELKEIEQRNFGKFWQTVREQPNVELDPEIAEPEIMDTLNELRAKTPEKGIYGGRGWANYAATYFNDCLRFARGTHWCLRPGASALVVIGNSILQGIPVPTDRFLAQIAGAAGLETVAIHVPRSTRVGNSIINSGIRVGPVGRKNRLYEAVVELKKP